jgi:sortase A
MLSPGQNQTGNGSQVFSDEQRNKVRYLERALLTMGLVLLAAYGAAKLHSAISSYLALRRFEAEQKQTRLRAQESAKQRTGETVDFSLWSDKRVQAYMNTLATKEGAPSAVLRIPKLNLQVPVYDGTDDLTLNRGVGRIIGTAQLGEAGNIGIAGHRDGFFRGLKDIGPGDTVELMMPSRTNQYVVKSVQITSPEDVSVLQPTIKPSLTLVTCYPFYFVGSAPQRYIVQAAIANPGETAQGSQGDPGVPSFTPTKRRE